MAPAIEARKGLFFAYPMNFLPKPAILPER